MFRLLKPDSVFAERSNLNPPKGVCVRMGSARGRVINPEMRRGEAILSGMEIRLAPIPGRGAEPRAFRCLSSVWLMALRIAYS
jgi:hypothetical protein